jgi:CrcB protein
MAGSISRYLLQQAVLRHYTTIFPLGTFVVNMIGSLLIGVIFGLAERYDWMTQEWRILLAIGFCGSFTTYSTFAFDNLQLLRDANYTHLIWYVLLSLSISIFFVWMGFILSRGQI